MMDDMHHLPALPLPKGLESSYVDCTESCGLRFHILEAGKGGPDRPLLLFVHGFPEIAYSWRKLLPRFADEGYYAVALDQRGYGRTTGWDRRPYADVDMTQFRYTQLVRDLLCLVNRLGRKHVDCIIGHDFGSITVAMSALMRPDFFKACVIMSHPFDGVPSLPSEDPKDTPVKSNTDADIENSLAQLGRKHYKWSNSSPQAAAHWEQSAQGLTDFLRGYIYLKSAKDPRNKPKPLAAWTASELAQMPHYYIQKLHLSMAETVAEDTQGQDVSSTQSFLSDAELVVYVGEWQRTGFQGALNWYRSGTSPSNNRELILFAGRKIECPTTFISGKADWGNFQKPGALEGMSAACADFRGVHFVREAGHWPQQEQPDEVFMLICNFIRGLQ
ncbi:MAG: hypothetical protein LQ340_004186 [Diploschistes diacapsis]|nr:MAG: hypothetical protein LQ340_004186 [Diploschistes diacapsis]